MRLTLDIFAEKKNIKLSYKERKILLKKKLKSTLYDLSKNNKVILLYPSPISPVNVLDRIKNKWVNHNFENDKIYLKDKINYSVKFYRKFNEDIIKLFDSINSSSIFKINREPVFAPTINASFLTMSILIFLIISIHLMKEVEK